MLRGYAKERGLKRVLIPTLVYAPRLSAYWVHMVTPVPWRIILPLIEGLHNESVVHDDLAKHLFTQIHPLAFDEAVHLELGRLLSNVVETSWSNALVTAQGNVRPVKLVSAEGMLIEHHELLVELPNEIVFRSYSGL
jgi:hypothetical protein